MSQDLLGLIPALFGVALGFLLPRLGDWIDNIDRRYKLRLPVGLAAGFDELVEAGVTPALLYTPMRPGYEDDPDDPHPRWLLYDQTDKSFHCHGQTADEAMTDMLRMVRAGRRPKPNRWPKAEPKSPDE